MTEPTSGKRWLLVNYLLFGVFLVWIVLSFVIVGEPLTGASWYMPVSFALAGALAAAQFYVRRQFRMAREDAERSAPHPRGE
ncbi:hypothetical protein [Acrocarpospora phusangensis]|nr:hypothetical protein [Acrocarpospora phusangensis]